MSGYGRRAERWAIAVLEAVWADRRPPRAWGLDAADLHRLLRSNERVRDAHARLAMLEDILADEVDLELELREESEGLVAEGLHVVGPYTLAIAEAPRRFAARVEELWTADVDPLRRPFPALPAVLAGVGATAVALLLVLRPAAPDTDLGVRGTAPSGSVQVGAYCLVEGDAGVRTWLMSPTRGCPVSGHLATSVTDARGRELGVVVFGVQRSSSGLRLVPYAPTPAAGGAVMLELGATEQRLGAVRRLGVNHQPGPLEVVAIAFSGPVEWSDVGRALGEVERTLAPDAAVESVGERVEALLERPDARPVGRSVVRSRLSVQ